MPHSPECNSDLISDAIDGLLDAKELAALQHHLEKCPSCTKIYEDLKQVSCRLHTITEAPVPNDLMNGIRKTIRAEIATQQKQRQSPFSMFTLSPRRGLALAGAACLVAILALWGPAQKTVPQNFLVALQLNTLEEVAGLDMELILPHKGTEAGKPVVPSGLGDFVVASHTHGSTMKVSMASAQAIQPSGKTRILEVPLILRAGSDSGTEGIRILSMRAYRLDGKPVYAEIKATPMLPSRDSKLNTTA